MASKGSAAAKQLLISCLMLTVAMATFFVSAGQIWILRAWMFFGATFLHLAASTAALYRFSPELLVQRLRRERPGSKGWDEILMRASNLTVLIAVPAAAGLDVGRFGSSSIGIEFAAVGIGLLVSSSVLLNWAMTSNPFFEPTVRIQRERGHRVIASGPYGTVRHPGYLAGILYAFSMPLVIGSVLAFIPTGVYFTLMITRTVLEDRALMKELDGYRRYARRVRHRLFPWIW